MVCWQGPLNTNYRVKCYQKVKPFCELFHCTNALVLGKVGKCLWRSSLEEKWLTFKTVALFCKYFRKVHRCPEIQIYACFAFNENGEGKYCEIPNLISINMTKKCSMGKELCLYFPSTFPACVFCVLTFSIGGTSLIFPSQYPCFLGICDSAVMTWPTIYTVPFKGRQWSP